MHLGWNQTSHLMLDYYWNVRLGFMYYIGLPHLETVALSNGYRSTMIKTVVMDDKLSKAFQPQLKTVFPKADFLNYKSCVF